MNIPPTFVLEQYNFNLSENARDNDEVGLITVNDDTGMPIIALCYYNMPFYLLCIICK